MSSYSKKMMSVKSIPRHIEILALLLLLTSNLPLLKVGPVSLSFFIGLILLLVVGKKYLPIGKDLRSLAFFAIFSEIALFLSPVNFLESSAFILLQVIYWFFIAVLFRNIGNRLSPKSISKVVLSIELVFCLVFYLYGEINSYLSANFSSFILVTLWPLSAFLANNRIWKVFAVFIAIIGLFLIGSRTGIIVVFIQIVTIYVIRNMTGNGKIILVVSIFFFTALISSQSIRTALSKTVEPLNQDIAMLVENPELVFVMDKSWAQRRIQQEKCKQVFLQYPIIGVGPMNVVNYNIIINETNLTEIDARVLGAEIRNSDKRSAHNAYYQLIADNGIIGTILILYFFFYLLKGLYKRSLESEQHVAFFISLVGFVLNLFMVSAFWGTNTWLLFGLYASMIKARQKQNLLT